MTRRTAAALALALAAWLASRSCTTYPTRPHVSPELGAAHTTTGTTTPKEPTR